MRPPPCPSLARSCRSKGRTGLQPPGRRRGANCELCVGGVTVGNLCLPAVWGTLQVARGDPSWEAQPALVGEMRSSRASGAGRAVRTSPRCCQAGISVDALRALVTRPGRRPRHSHMTGGRDWVTSSDAVGTICESGAVQTTERVTARHPPAARTLRRARSLETWPSPRETGRSLVK